MSNNTNNNMNTNHWNKAVFNVVNKPNLFDYPVEVKPSPGKGNGVFATRTIKQNQICCFYDGIVINAGVAGMTLAMMSSGEHGYNQNIPDKLERCIGGFPFQARPGGCAQLCNDVSMDYTDNAANYAKSNIKPVMHIMKNGLPLLIFLAKRNIYEGEELLYHYGKEYWETHVMKQTDEYEFNKFDGPNFPKSHPANKFHSPQYLIIYQNIVAAYCNMWGVNGAIMSELTKTLTAEPSIETCLKRIELLEKWRLNKS